jgi:hypothetical protein
VLTSLVATGEPECGQRDVLGQGWAVKAAGGSPDSVQWQHHVSHDSPAATIKQPLYLPTAYCREFNPTLQEAWDNYEASQGSTVLKEGRQWAPWHNQQEPVLNPAAASAHTIGSISTHHIPYSCQAHNPAAVRTSCFQRNGSGMSFAASPASPSTPQYTMQVCKTLWYSVI